MTQTRAPQDTVTATEPEPAPRPALSVTLLRPGPNSGPDAATAIAMAQALRHQVFRKGPGQDSDALDLTCRHLLVWRGPALVACCRLQAFAPGDDLSTAYAARFYDLAPLAAKGEALIEIGRVCLDPSDRDPAILRLVFATLLRLAGQEACAGLFGCTSLPGAEADHSAALAALKPHVTALPPGRRAAQTLPLTGQPDPAALPSLLRFYLALGAKVSDHAVIDRDLDTVHVLTHLALAAIPPARLRFLLQ